MGKSMDASQVRKCSEYFEMVRSLLAEEGFLWRGSYQFSFVLDIHQLGTDPAEG